MPAAEIQNEAVLRDKVTAVASSLSPRAMIAFPVLGAILLPVIVALPGAALQ